MDFMGDLDAYCNKNKIRMMTKNKIKNLPWPLGHCHIDLQQNEMVGQMQTVVEPINLSKGGGTKKKKKKNFTLIPKQTFKWVVNEIGLQRFIFIANHVI